MLELTRTVRFCLGADGSLATDAPVANAFAAWPPMRGLGRYYELRVTCRGETEATTGYFMNIKRIDAAVRDEALPLIERAAGGQRAFALGAVMRDILGAVDAALDGAVAAVELRPAPSYALTLEKADMDHVLISQRYEFSAAHRLHSPHLSERENRRTFGKCNNPAGHGHNYEVEVTVRAPIDAEGRVTDVEKLDELVDRTAIDPLDHTNLDVDVPAFHEQNTSVENIARTVHGMLAEPVRQLGLELERVRVWETGKTVCAYPA